MRFLKRQKIKLLNERIRSINKTLYICGIKRDTCYNRLKSVLDRDTLQECQSFKDRVRQSRHTKVMDRQKGKLSRLSMKYRGNFSSNHSGYMYKSTNFGIYMYGSFSGHSNNILTD